MQILVMFVQIKLLKPGKINIRASRDSEIHLLV